MPVVIQKIKSGTITAPQEITYYFREIDVITNDDEENDLTVTFYDRSGVQSGSFVIKPGESLNDVEFPGSKIGFAGTKVNARYILLG